MHACGRGVPCEPRRGEHHRGRDHSGALLDAGYTIRALDENGVMGDVDAAAQLNANSYYSGLYLAKDGVNCAGLEVTADEAVPLSGGTVARVYVAAAEGHTLEGAAFDGVGTDRADARCAHTACGGLPAGGKRRVRACRAGLHRAGRL